LEGISLTFSGTKTKEVRALEWTNNRLRLLDQTLLPTRVQYTELERWPEVVTAITSMQVRGAPALGVAGAYAVVLAALELKELPLDEFREKLRAAASSIAEARPTAVNLAWAVSCAMNAAAFAANTAETIKLLLAEAQTIEREDIEANHSIGEHGSLLLPQDATVMTHCNAGALATAGYGTALGVIRTAWAQGKLKGVIATETRPLLQGARLTTWELTQAGIPTTLIVDSAAASVLRSGKVSAIVVGADRIAANGDVANKIGTYGLAVLAKAHSVPFYVAAPMSTVDLATATGDQIVVEERAPEEVSSPQGVQTAPDEVGIYNPAFDVTPAEYVSAIITERGAFTAPYSESLNSGAQNRG
jgi:methylthioribose-1-phosphate isomerase